MKVITVSYNVNADKTTIAFAADFDKLDGIEQLQIYEDLLAEINARHNALMVPFDILR